MWIRFVVEKKRGNSRIGYFKHNNHKIKTPVYFPMLNFMTGDNSKAGFYQNGGVFRWLKILLVHKTDNPFFLSQILHFIDFGIYTKEKLKKWIKKTIKKHIKDKNVISFIDSGGFQFLNDCNNDLKEFLKNNLSIDVDKNGIYNLQKKLGSSIIISFDYPLNPLLRKEEAIERCKKSIKNAINTLKMVNNDRKYNPLVMLAVHGQDDKMARWYTKTLFERIKKLKLKKTTNFGLAIGSLVPLTASRHKDYYKVVRIVKAVKDSIPKKYQDIPIHALGMSGSIIPLLVYLGVDSFDGSSFIVGAQNRKYVLNGKSKGFLKLKKSDINCNCLACRWIKKIGLDKCKKILRGKFKRKIKFLSNKDPREKNPAFKNKKGNDHKSAIYALLAYHNLYSIYKKIKRIREAINKDNLLNYIKKIKNGNGLKDAIKFINSNEKNPPIKKTKQFKNISLRYTNKSFNILKKRYKPPKGKNILLIVPCTPEKPYSKSATHSKIFHNLKENLGCKEFSKIHKLTVSGLYGPVPKEFENKKQVLEYDYRLRTYSIFNKQKEGVTKRLIKYLEKYGKNYKKIIGFCNKKPYRKIIERALAKTENSFLLPKEVKNRNKLDSEENLRELIKLFYSKTS